MRKIYDIESRRYFCLNPYHQYYGVQLLILPMYHSLPLSFLLSFFILAILKNPVIIKPLLFDTCHQHPCFSYYIRYEQIFLISFNTTIRLFWCIVTKNITFQRPTIVFKLARSQKKLKFYQVISILRSYNQPTQVICYPA